MLAFFVKFIRVVLFYGLYLFLCMLLVATFLQGWLVGEQMLFAFGVPSLLVWIQEKHWSKKRRRRALLDAKPTAVGGNETAVKRAALPPGLSRPEKADVTSVLPVETNRETVRDIPSAPMSPIVTGAATLAPLPKPSVQPSDASVVKAVQAFLPSAGLWDTSPDKARSPEALPRETRAATWGASREGWVPKGEHAVVAKRYIGGMIYVGRAPKLNDHGYRDKSRAFIDPSLQVDTWGEDKTGRGMPYWPGYSEISAICRATYLNWLADGRRDPGYDAGYMFLYFYGLERRFFVDQPDDSEKREILEEVRRLATLYPQNGSVQRYLGEFIGIAEVALNDVAASKPIFDFRGWQMPYSLMVAIGTKIAQDEPLTWDWLLSWLICHPEHYLRTPATRCPEEFRALFRLRFEQRFPQGLKVTKPRKVLKLQYQAASSEFQADLTPKLGSKPVLDISGLRKPLEVGQEIVDEVTEALDKLSRYLGRVPEGRGSIEAQTLLPAELRALFPSEALEALRAWAAEHVAQGGLVPAAEVIARFGAPRPEKLTKSMLTAAADTLARIGFGLAPDPRFALRAPKIDEPLVIFALGEAIENMEEVSAAYRAALLELALGAFVVQADGVISEAERAALIVRIEDAAGLSAPERLRLKANMDWFLAIPPDMALLRRKLKETGAETHVALRAALIGAAHADGIIQSDEVAGIEKLYKALGLDPGLVYSDIHAGDVLDGPVRVKPATIGAPGEAIPDGIRQSVQKLDPALIAAIQSDTARVSSVLGEIFGTEAPEPEYPAPVGVQVINGLDAATTALVIEIAEETHLTEAAFEAICARHGLMPAGALETINEWAFDTHDEALLDAYDGYDVAPEIAAALKAEFAKEGQHVHA